MSGEFIRAVLWVFVGMFLGMSVASFGEYLEPSTPEMLWNGGWLGLFAAGMCALCNLLIGWSEASGTEKTDGI